MLDSRIDDDLSSGCSSGAEELEHHEGGSGTNNNMSPMSFEKLRAEKKYQKRFKQVFDTLVDRVEGQSSSGNNSSDDTKNIPVNRLKKRKFNEFNDAKSGQYIQGAIKRRHPNNEY